MRIVKYTHKCKLSFGFCIGDGVLRRSTKPNRRTHWMHTAQPASHQFTARIPFTHATRPNDLLVFFFSFFVNLQLKSMKLFSRIAPSPV